MIGSRLNRITGAPSCEPAGARKGQSALIAASTLTRGSRRGGAAEPEVAQREAVHSGDHRQHGRDQPGAQGECCE